MIHNIIKNIVFGKNGVEIGGPSDFTGPIIYANVSNIDNVVFKMNTVWYDNKHYNKGKIIINDAINLVDIKDNTYDFVFASHILEHVANPLKAVEEFIRIIKDDGYIIIVVPEKSVCFDHKREYTKFSTLLSQFEKNVGEDDLSTLPEILRNHDLSLDPLAGNFENFTKRCLNNYENRCMHHYVYNYDLLMDIKDYFKCQYIYKETESINIWFIMKKIVYKDNLDI